MKPYRKNVGIVVFNKEGKVLVGERLNFNGFWQFPQGGVDEGEELLSAAKRELYEEVGIGNATFVYELEDWIKYDFPEYLKIKLVEKYSGQTQKWFLFYWNHDISECNLQTHEQEFERVQFIDIEKSHETIVEFKKHIYEHLIEKFSPIIKKFVQGL
jgi:putative (di)nucleoside polyphosphate hydrolase